MRSPWRSCALVWKSSASRAFPTAHSPPTPSPVISRKISRLSGPVESVVSAVPADRARSSRSLSSFARAGLRDSQKNATDARTSQSHTQEHCLLGFRQVQNLAYRDQQERKQYQVVEVEHPSNKSDQLNLDWKSLGCIRGGSLCGKGGRTITALAYS